MNEANWMLVVWNEESVQFRQQWSKQASRVHFDLDYCLSESYLTLSVWETAIPIDSVSKSCSNKNIKK